MLLDTLLKMRLLFSSILLGTIFETFNASMITETIISGYLHICTTFTIK